MKNLWVLFCFSLLFSCSPAGEVSVDIPPEVMPKEKMAKVMVDVHLLEATLNIGTFSRDNVVIGNISPATDILKKNGITKQQYDESFLFYSRNPKLLAEIYQLVLNDLSKMQAEVMTKK